MPSFTSATLHQQRDKGTGGLEGPAHTAQVCMYACSVKPQQGHSAALEASNPGHTCDTDCSTHGSNRQSSGNAVKADLCVNRVFLPLQVSRKEMQATLALRFGGEGILKMKGIPFKATAADVRKFFANYKIKPDGVR